MTENPLTKKLGVKPGQRVLILNAPTGYPDKLRPLPDGVEVVEKAGDGGFEIVLAFVGNRAAVEELSGSAIEAVKPGGWLWFAYPKKSGKVATDINRDNGWQSVRARSWDTVTQVALDEVWSALRFRPADQINYTPGSGRQARANR